MADVQYYGTGKRKRSVARVFLRPGSGKITINRRELGDYFQTGTQTSAVMEPLQAVEATDTYDLFVTVKGGGTSGQAGAVRHGIARALLDADPERRAALKAKGLLVRSSARSMVNAARVRGSSSASVRRG